MGRVGCLMAAMLFLVPFPGRGQAFLPDNFLKVREQNRDLTAAELENHYNRPAEFYLRDFDKSIDFSKVIYLDEMTAALELTRDEEALLRRNLFMVSERLSYTAFGHAFHTVYNHDLPVFVTTDAILHALHMSYDQILKTLEREVMSVNLEKFLEALYTNFSLLNVKYGDNKALADALADADLYVTIAHSLMSGTLKEGHVASSEDIGRVWDAIKSEKLTEMPLFTFPERSRKLDFSQFTVRGHYVYTEQDKWMGLKSLEPYFRAMMWLGRTDFLLTPPPENPWEVPWSDPEIQRMHQGAFLLQELCRLTPEQELLDWNEKVITFLVGACDNITPEAFGKVLAGMGIASAGQLADLSLSRELQQTLGKDPRLAQQILSDFFLMDPWAEEPGLLPVSWRLSGQRFIIDAHILGNVVFDRVMYNGQKVMRMMPSPLDALFVLGNNDALPLLRDELDKYPYAGQLANLRYLTDARPETFWQGSLYNVWLNALRDLNPGEGEDDLPLFMQTAAWHQEKINTQLAGWSQLRHDNLLYAKQSYTGGTGCSFPVSYVEPYPLFYRRLKEFAGDAALFFGTIQAASPQLNKVIAFFPHFGEVMGKLEILAAKELAGEPFTAAEREWLMTMLFHHGMSGEPPYSGWYADLFYDVWDASEWDHTIVDVHTQPTDETGHVVGRVLHTGTGKVNLGVFLACHPDNPGVLTAFAGPLLSYYEKVTDNFERMTDQEWEQLVWQDNLPDRPEWTHIYLAGKEGQLRPKGAELPSQGYTSTSVVTPTPDHVMAVWPNPVHDILHMTISSETAGECRVSLFNAAGVVVRAFGNQITGRGVNTLHLSMGGLKTGIYLVRVETPDGQVAVKKVIKK